MSIFCNTLPSDMLFDIIKSAFFEYELQNADIEELLEGETRFARGGERGWRC